MKKVKLDQDGHDKSLDSHTGVFVRSSGHPNKMFRFPSLSFPFVIVSRLVGQKKKKKKMKEGSISSCGYPLLSRLKRNLITKLTLKGMSSLENR